MTPQKWLAHVFSSAAIFLALVAIGLAATGNLSISLPAPPAFNNVDDGPSEPPAPSSRNASGIQFRFTPGEQLNYRLDAAIAGGGFELGDSAAIRMNFTCGMMLHTRNVDRSGNADMRVQFSDARMAGSFMDSPFEFALDSRGASMNAFGKQTIDEPNGLGSIKGIPQLEFFRQPIDMRVAPDGEVLSVAGGKDGSAGFISSLPTMTRIEFPDRNVQAGTTWTSRFTLPIPGFSSAPEATMQNTLVGFQQLNGRTCAVIRQELGSSQRDGKLESPASALGDSASFSMPHYELNGTNYTYVDTQTGHVVHTNLDMRLLLKIQSLLDGAANGLGGEAGGQIAQVTSILQNTLGALYGLADDPLGQGSATPAEAEKSLLDLDVQIKGTLQLVGQSG